MFSKALFKQSCKSNWLMWTITTFAVCFMLACVMMISGGGNITTMKNAIEDTIIKGEITAAMESRSLNYYDIADNGLQGFDGYFVANYSIAATYDAQFTNWLSDEPQVSDYGTEGEYNVAHNTWLGNMPQTGATTESPNVKGVYLSNYNNWLSNKPQVSNYATTELYNTALATWSGNMPTGTTKGVIPATYSYATYLVQASIIHNASELGYSSDSLECQEMVAVFASSLNPNGMFDSFYALESSVPEVYDVASLLNHMTLGDITTYLTSTERLDYITNRSTYSSAVFLAGNMTKTENVDKMVTQLSKYGVTAEKFASFGYDYEGIKHISNTTIVTYVARYDYELGLINDKNTNGDYETEQDYLNAIASMKTDLTKDLSSSLLATLPQSVSDGLEEVGQLDMYSMIVGTIFYKMAGLLLPMIFMIMSANNLIAAQVDSGSMAYILSTSTKRRQVTFTQALYLVGALFATFALTTITSLVCLAILNNPEIALTYGKLILINLGAFITIFAMSGICFLASCWFDRSKRSMAVGGGLSMFFLVSTMLGLFGSKVLPSVVRLDTLNMFNYTSLITLFDTTSILSGTTNFIWKLAILVVVGVVCYVIGARKFDKKDLPL